MMHKMILSAIVVRPKFRKPIESDSVNHHAVKRPSERSCRSPARRSQSSPCHQNTLCALVPALPRVKCPEPRQRLEVAKQAQRSAGRNPWLRGSLAVYVVLCILLWPSRNQDFYHGLFYILTFGGMWFFLGCKFIVARRETVRISKQFLHE